MKKKSLAVPLPVPNNIKRVFGCRKIESIEGEGLMFTYIAVKNDPPYEIINDYELRVLFTGGIYAMKMYIDSCLGTVEYELESTGWICEVKNSLYLKEINNNSCNSISDLRHYTIGSFSEVYDIITGSAPEITIVDKI